MLAAQERLFTNAVGAGTGLDPRVVYAQVIQEGAYAPGGTGGLNFLNLAASTVKSLGLPFAGSSSGGFAHFANLGQAEQASIAEYKSPAIGLVTPASTPAGQISQIAASPWDAGHYGGPGGPSLASTFAAEFGSGALGTTAQVSPIASNPAVGLPGTSGSTPIASSYTNNPAQAAKDLLAGNITLAQAQAANPGTTFNVGGNPTNPFSSVDSFFSWIGNTKNLQRLGEMLAGGVLIALGVVMIGRAASSSSPATQVKGAAETVAAPVRTVRSRSAARRAPAVRAPIRSQPRRAQRRAGFMLPADQRRPKRGAPGSSRLGKGDSIPY